MSNIPTPQNIVDPFIMQKEVVNWHNIMFNADQWIDLINIEGVQALNDVLNTSPDLERSKKELITLIEEASETSEHLRKLSSDINAKMRRYIQYLQEALIEEEGDY